jgi:biopolymer transport protein ExbD
MVQSIIEQTALQSQLQSNSVLGPKQSRWKRILAADLLLTALIDAFSILVIFLLMSFSSTGEIIFINKGMELPKSTKADELERNPIVKIEENQIYLESKAVGNGDSLFQALLEMRKKFTAERPKEEFSPVVTVQADRRIKYEFLNQVVVACAQAGFSDIRFAVLMK